jgi:RNA polymerase sigma-70 factor (ECF subfamily)
MSDSQELIRKAARGDRQAFRTLVNEHKEKVFALALDLTGSMDDAEDLSQEVFLKAYRSLGQFRGDCAVATWLHTITVRIWIDLNRSVSGRLRNATNSIDENPVQESLAFRAPTSDHPESRVEGLLIRGHIDRALGALSPRERSVFTLRFFHDRKLAEIGAVLSISEGAVKSHLFNAIRKMRRKLAFLMETQ